MFRQFGAGIIVVAAGVLTTGAGRADVFDMPDGQKSLVTVRVGDPGNAGNTRVYGSLGAVAYTYRIGKYDVTNAQYCEFLNAKASNGDPYGLWNSNMGSDAEGGITRTGTDSGPYAYTVKSGHDNQPVVDVNWYDAIRFANWLNNGQGNGDTETGSYTLLGGTPIPSNYSTISRNAGAQWFLPSEGEWYKAAYYKGGSTHAGYWTYPTQSDTAPTWELSTAVGPNPGTNSANFMDETLGFALTGSNTVDPSVDYLTDVGAYPDSVSAYGTLDQGGDVLQWNEGVYLGSIRFLRGGWWGAYAEEINDRIQGWSPSGCTYAGFRVVALPEPAGVTLAVCGAASVLIWWKRRW